MDRTVGRGTPRRRSARQSRLFVIVLSLQLAVLGVMGMGIGAIGAIFYSVSGIDIELSVKTTKEDTKIYSSDGIELASLFQEEHRERVPLDRIPENLKNATVAIEDSRFYKHAGVDIRGISRALYQNLRHHTMVQGGSTITQQLARNVYLTKRKTLTRKLQEAALAVRIESQYSKDHILEVYLNQVYYGSGAYGVQTASRIYFGKDVQKLDLAQAAILAGLPRRPSYYSPFVNIDEAAKRRNTVLQRMAELGYITRETAKEAQDEPIRLASKRPIQRRYRAGYFIDYVVGQLIDRYGEDLVTGGGLRIYTTVNWRMQQKAEQALAEGIGKYKSKNVGQGTLVAIEPGTGHIKAMVGGTSYAETQFNRATQAYRQPGSAFKAFVYTAAIDRGVIDLDSKVLDTL
jgi:penicillin-binding protein 1A